MRLKKPYLVILTALCFAITSCKPQVDRLAVFTKAYNEQQKTGIYGIQMFGKNSQIFDTHAEIIPREGSTQKDIQITFSSYIKLGDSSIAKETEQLKHSFIVFIDKNQLTKDLLKRGVNFQLSLLSRNGSTLAKEVIDSTSYKLFNGQDALRY